MKRELTNDLLIEMIENNVFNIDIKITNSSQGLVFVRRLYKESCTHCPANIESNSCKKFRSNISKEFILANAPQLII